MGTTCCKPSVEEVSSAPEVKPRGTSTSSGAAAERAAPEPNSYKQTEAEKLATGRSSNTEKESVLSSVDNVTASTRDTGVSKDSQVANVPIDKLVVSSAAPSNPPANPGSKLRTDCKVRDVYRLSKTIGTGGFSVVKLAIDKRTNKEYACKIMALPPAGQQVGENESTREDIFKEIDILCGLNHENVIYLREYFEEGDKVYLITELLTGGELLDAVLQRGNYTESEARNCFVQLLRGIEYLHSRHVVHRDLKLENLLLASPDDMTKIKIADFGLAKKAVGDMHTICGTPQYVAPEVIKGTPGLVYGPGVDMWGAGVVLYILLGGYPPFWSESEPLLFELIRKGAFTFNDPVWKTVSDSAKDLICQLLVVDPAMRLTSSQALKHPWVVGELHQQQSAPLLWTQKHLVTKLRHKLKFKGMVYAVIAAHRWYRLAQARAPSAPVDQGTSTDQIKVVL